MMSDTKMPVSLLPGESTGQNAAPEPGLENELPANQHPPPPSPLLIPTFS